MTIWPPSVPVRPRRAPKTALTLMVERRGRDEPVLQWSEVQSEGHIVRTTFESCPPLSAALLPPLGQQVAALLHRCGTEPGLIRPPDARIEAAGLVLTQFCIQNAQRADARQACLVRFRLASGRVDRVLAGTATPANAITADRQSENLRNTGPLSMEPILGRMAGVAIGPGAIFGGGPQIPSSRRARVRASRSGSASNRRSAFLRASSRSPRRVREMSGATRLRCVCSSPRGTSSSRRSSSTARSCSWPSVSIRSFN